MYKRRFLPLDLSVCHRTSFVKLLHNSKTKKNNNRLPSKYSQQQNVAVDHPFRIDCGFVFLKRILGVFSCLFDDEWKLTTW